MVFQGERYIIPEIEGMSDVIVGDLFYQSLMEKGAFSGEFEGNQLLWIGWSGGYVGNSLEADALPIPTDFDYPECKGDADKAISYAFVFRMIEAMRNLLSNRKIESTYADFCGCYLRDQTCAAAKLVSDAEVRALYEALASYRS
ncbi:MAG: hypothetical protein N3E49_09515 [Bacteroidia bacterium]|nr:hypothetical protein [Bacteroidia bacterium]